MRFESKNILVLIFVAIIAITGCMSGGGSGTPVPSNPADVAQITNTIQSFANALVVKDQTSLSSLVSSTCTTTECYHTLVVYDFGADLASSTDNASWSFSVDSSEIKQYGDYAEVVARYNSVEPKITIYFNLVKENGKWIIDKLDLGGVLPTSTSTYTHTHIDTGTYTPTETDTNTGTTTSPTTVDNIRIFDYIPTTSDTEYWFQTFVNGTIQANDRKRLQKSMISQSIAGISFQDFSTTSFSNGSPSTSNFYNPVTTATRDAFGTDSNRNFCYYSDTSFFGESSYVAMFPEYVNLPNASYTLATFTRTVGQDSESLLIKVSRSSSSYTYLGQTFNDTLQITVSRYVNNQYANGYVTLLAKGFGPFHRSESQNGGSIYLENRIIYARVGGVAYGTPPTEYSSTEYLFNNK